MEGINYKIGQAKAEIKNKERVKDWELWLYKPMWNSNQAVCLCHGVEPESIRGDDLGELLKLYGISANEFRTPYQWKCVALKRGIETLKPIRSISEPSINFGEILNRETLKFDELWLISHEIDPTKVDTPINNAIWLKGNDEYNDQLIEFKDWVRTGKLKAKAISTGDGTREYQDIAPVDFFNLAKANNWFLPEPIHEWLKEQTSQFLKIEPQVTANFDVLEPESETLLIIEVIDKSGIDENERESQLHALLWRVRQHIYSSGNGNANKVWSEIRYRHKNHDTEGIIQTTSETEITWRSSYGNLQAFKRTSLDSCLTRLKNNPPF
ncbi:MAG: hypothetical protein ACXW03_01230 [Methylobacter sp.]